MLDATAEIEAGWNLIEGRNAPIKAWTRGVPFELAVPPGAAVNQDVYDGARQTWESRFEAGYRWILEAEPKV